LLDARRSPAALQGGCRPAERGHRLIVRFRRRGSRLAESPIGFPAIAVSSGRRHWLPRIRFMLGACRAVSVESGTWHGVQISFIDGQAMGFDHWTMASGEQFCQNSQGRSPHLRIGVIFRRRHQKIARGFRSGTCQSPQTTFLDGLFHCRAVDRDELVAAPSSPTAANWSKAARRTGSDLLGAVNSLNFSCTFGSAE
jgi:hypothetical protein